MHIDVELALTKAPASELVRIQKSLPQGFVVEDRSDRGWGLVIGDTQQRSDDFNQAIDGFLLALAPMTDIVRNRTLGGLLRVGVFHKTITCTLQIAADCCEQLARMRLPIEISTYPSNENE